ncbi:hypothetical protein EVA_12638 [gut metagenome]|uniref:Uncharacterized protein n=1 Tax=gut metagenome TaxID=749906 RepID=J9CGU1_9ZZZZ
MCMSITLCHLHRVMSRYNWFRRLIRNSRPFTHYLAKMHKYLTMRKRLPITTSIRKSMVKNHPWRNISAN